MAEKYLRGARPSPRHKLLAAEPHKPIKAPLPQFAVVPKQLSMWGNSQYGDCVSAEEAYAKACWSIQCGLPETFISEAEVISWASANGFLNGADLTSVMEAMARSGMVGGGTKYNDGGYQGVDYTNLAVLQSAIFQGPVKIAIDANALPSGAGNGNGWHAFGKGNFPNTDHCVGLSGYGTAAFCFGLLGVPVPAGVDPNKPDCVLLFTWDSVGVVDLAWLAGTCTEAWVRVPTTVGQSPTPPVPPTPTPVPPGPMPMVIHVPQQPVVIGGFHVGHVPAFDVSCCDKPAGPFAGGTLPTPVWLGVPVAGAPLTIPPALLLLLRVACSSAIVLPPPYGLILSVLCGLLPKSQRFGDTDAPAIVAVPPWFLPLLRAVCGFVQFLPENNQAEIEAKKVAQALCALLPAQAAKDGCGCGKANDKPENVTITPMCRPTFFGLPNPWAAVATDYAKFLADAAVKTAQQTDLDTTTQTVAGDVAQFQKDYQAALDASSVLVLPQ